MKNGKEIVQAWLIDSPLEMRHTLLIDLIDAALVGAHRDYKRIITELQSQVDSLKKNLVWQFEARDVAVSLAIEETVERCATEARNHDKGGCCCAETIAADIRALKEKT